MKSRLQFRRLCDLLYIEGRHFVSPAEDILLAAFLYICTSSAQTFFGKRRLRNEGEFDLSSAYIHHTQLIPLGNSLPAV